RVQVKYVEYRPQEWSRRGRGNYWSDYLGWDLNGDGIGDVPYLPNDAVDRILWDYPLSRLLMNSPTLETLRWVQNQFPVLQPPGVQDSYPLMKSPHLLKGLLAEARKEK
ncbi:MAG: copper-binding protein, partial [Gammaproteobacteria bacterium]|nr:copper-binding protein [Gammaproteobacteria bacterium]